MELKLLNWTLSLSLTKTKEIPTKLPRKKATGFTSKNWKTKELQILIQSYNNKETPTQISTKLDRTPTAIAVKLSNLKKRGVIS